MVHTALFLLYERYIDKIKNFKDNKIKEQIKKRDLIWKKLK